MKDVFISYSTKDQEAKEELKKIFDENGISYFLDENDLELGKDIAESLQKNLRNTNFTILIVSKNSLLSTWVGMETMFRLQQESFYDDNTLICIITDAAVFDLRFPIEMQKEFKGRREELEALRKEFLEMGGQTAVYDTEIHRIDKINVGEVMIKIRNHLGAVLNDPARRDNDLEKLIQTIKTKQGKTEEKQPSSVETNTPNTEKANTLDDFKKELSELLTNQDFSSIFEKVQKSSFQYDRGLFNRIQQEMTFGINLDLVKRLEVFITTLKNKD